MRLVEKLHCSVAVPHAVPGGMFRGKVSPVIQDFHAMFGGGIRSPGWRVMQRDTEYASYGSTMADPRVTAIHVRGAPETLTTVGNLGDRWQAMRWLVRKIYLERREPGLGWGGFLGVEVSGLQLYKEQEARRKAGLFVGSPDCDVRVEQAVASGQDRDARWWREVRLAIVALVERYSSSDWLDGDPAEEVSAQFERIHEQYKQGCDVPSVSVIKTPGSNLPEAAARLAGFYESRLSQADENPAETVAHALGVPNLDILNRVWDVSMQQPTPRTAGQLAISELVSAWR